MSDAASLNATSMVNSSNASLAGALNGSTANVSGVPAWYPGSGGVCSDREAMLTVADHAERYSCAAYWSVQMLSTAGYGEIGALGRTERWVGVLAMLLGATLLHKLFVVVWGASGTSPEEDRDTAMWAVVRYMRERGMGKELIADTKRYHQESSVTTRGFVDLDETAHLPAPIRVRVFMQTHRRIVEDVQWLSFKNRDDLAFWTHLLDGAEAATYLAGDWISLPSDPANRVVLIRSGTVEEVSPAPLMPPNGATTPVRTRPRSRRPRLRALPGPSRRRRGGAARQVACASGAVVRVHGAGGWLGELEALSGRPRGAAGRAASALVDVVEVSGAHLAHLTEMYGEVCPPPHPPSLPTLAPTRVPTVHSLPLSRTARWARCCTTSSGRARSGTGTGGGGRRGGGTARRCCASRPRRARTRRRGRGRTGGPASTPTGRRRPRRGSSRRCRRTGLRRGAGGAASAGGAEASAAAAAAAGGRASRAWRGARRGARRGAWRGARAARAARRPGPSSSRAWTRARSP